MVSGPPPPHDPYEDIRISPIEKDESRQKKPNLFEEQPEEKKKALFAHFFTTLENIATFFLQSKNEHTISHQITENSIEFDLKQLLSAFEKLKVEDYSQDVAYLNKISTWWHQFLEHSGQFKKHVRLYKAIESFIAKIHEYPEDIEHTLGYYLIEYAGADWIPFPFMDMLQDLHLEHKKNPINSHLARWTRLLKDLLKKISRDW